MTTKDLDYIWYEILDEYAKQMAEETFVIIATDF